MLWGKLLSIDAFRCCPRAINSPVLIAHFNNELLKRIDMKPHGGAMIVKFGESGTPLYGYTLSQLLTTSNLSCHFSEMNKSLYLDLFSCKSFDNKVVEDTVREFFKAERIKSVELERPADETVSLNKDYP